MQRDYIAWCAISDLVTPTFFQDDQVVDSKPVLRLTLTANSSPSPTPPPSAGDIVIDAAIQFQTMVGFGASDGFLAIFLPNKWTSSLVRTAVLD